MCCRVSVGEAATGVGLFELLDRDLLETATSARNAPRPPPLHQEEFFSFLNSDGACPPPLCPNNSCHLFESAQRCQHATCFILGAISSEPYAHAYRDTQIFYCYAEGRYCVHFVSVICQHGGCHRFTLPAMVAPIHLGAGTLPWIGHGLLCPPVWVD